MRAPCARFRAAVKVNSKEPNVHFGLGYLLWKKSQYPEAAAEFQAELDNDAEHLQAMLYLADAKIQMNQTDDARPLLEKLIRLSPANGMAHRDLGIVYAEQDRKQEAGGGIRGRDQDRAQRRECARLQAGTGAIVPISMGKSAEAEVELDKASSLNKAEDERLLKVMSTIPNKERKPDAAAPK